MDGPPAVTAAESAVAEANAVALGLGVDVLMENAGRVVAEEVLRHLGPDPGRVAVLIGPGNNGGDGAAAAHYLRQFGVAVDVWDVAPAPHRSAPARHCLERATRPVPARPGAPTAAELAPYALVVDALLGVGHGGPMRPAIRDAVAAMAPRREVVLSIDTPTGLGDPDGLRPRWTVALGAPKAEVPADRTGELTVRDIGIPRRAWEETGPGEFLRYDAAPGRRTGARGGRVVVLGGGPYTGAPALAALAALRAGAERATVVAPERAAVAVRSYSPDLVVRAVGGDRFAPEFLDEARSVLASGPVGALVLGPGAGDAPPTVEFFATLLRGLTHALPVVVDADALRALPELGRDALSGRTIVATPNPGEFRRWLPAGAADAATPAAVRRVAAELGVTVVRKGAEDLVDDGSAAALNRHHPPEQAVAGAGDVLSGVLGALLARGLPPMGAARLATYWTGEAGHRAVALHGPGMRATDLLDALGPAGRDGLRRVRQDP